MSSDDWASFPAPCIVSYSLSTLFLQNIFPKYNFTLDGDDLSKLIVTAYARYFASNPLHPDVLLAIRKMEAEVVSMCRTPAAGVMTTGAVVPSIIMSIKTYRDWPRRVKGITEPEM